MRIEPRLPRRVQYASKDYEQGQYAPKVTGPFPSLICFAVSTHFLVRYTQLVIEFGPPPVGMHLLAARRDRPSHYGRMLGKATGSDTSQDEGRKSSKRKTTNKSSSRSIKQSNDSESNDESGVGDISVCPGLNPDTYLPMAVQLHAKGDSTIVAEEPDNASFGSDTILELSPPQCGNMQAMILFDVNSLVNATCASILIHAIEGSTVNGATFLHAPLFFDENTVTWRNAPDYDRVIGNINTIASGTVSLHR